MRTRLWLVVAALCAVSLVRPLSTLLDPEWDHLVAQRLRELTAQA